MIEATPLKAWLLAKLDDDSVRPWVPLYCAAWMIWAICALFWLPPVSTLSETMGMVGYYMWVTVSIIGNLGPIVGMWMRHGDMPIHMMSNPLLLRDWMGLIFQAGGHLICNILLITFQISAWITVITYSGPAIYAGMTLFTSFMLAPWTIGVLMLFAQCCRKLQRGLQIEQRMPL